MPNASRRTALRAALRAAATLAAAPAALAAAPAAAQTRAAPAVVVTLRPEPSLRVARGGRLTYRIDVRNPSRDAITDLRVALPIDPAQLTLLDSAFTADGDWVSDRSPNEIGVTFSLVRSSRERSALVTFRAAEGLSDNTVISMRAPYRWARYNRGGGSGVTNWAPVLVGSADASAPHVWASTTPDAAPSGAQLRLFSDRFLPGEDLAVWLNTPDGARPLDSRARAASDGAVRVDFLSRGLRPGAYSAVLYGQSSKLSAVAGFIVQ